MTYTRETMQKMKREVLTKYAISWEFIMDRMKDQFPK